MTPARRVILCIFIGIIAGFFCQEILKATNSHGDFFVALRMSRDLRESRDPYASPVWEDFISYPLPAALLSLPLSYLPDPLSSGVFMGICSALLAWLVMTHGKPWQLGMLLSWPFVYAIFFAQWIPLVTCLWFSPLFAFVGLVKPQIAIPLFFTQKPDWRGITVAVALGVLSLLVYPAWPWMFLKQTAGYKGILPPFFVLPLGPLMLLALIRWRTRRAWLLLLMALMPQRVVYDQLPLLLVASSWRQLAILVVASWSTVPALLHFGGWNSMPGGWQIWILATLYVPALLVVLLGHQEKTKTAL